MFTLFPFTVNNPIELAPVLLDTELFESPFWFQTHACFSNGITGVAILFCILYTFTCLWCHTHRCMQMKPRFSPFLGSGLRHFSILPQHSCRIIPYTKKSKFLNRLAKDFLVGFTPGYPSDEARSLLLDRDQGLIHFCISTCCVGDPIYDNIPGLSGKISTSYSVESGDHSLSFNSSSIQLFQNAICCQYIIYILIRIFILIFEIWSFNHPFSSKS